MDKNSIVFELLKNSKLDSDQVDALSDIYSMAYDDPKNEEGGFKNYAKYMKYTGAQLKSILDFAKHISEKNYVINEAGNLVDFGNPIGMRNAILCAFEILSPNLNNSQIMVLNGKLDKVPLKYIYSLSKTGISYSGMYYILQGYEKDEETANIIWTAYNNGYTHPDQLNEILCGLITNINILEYTSPDMNPDEMGFIRHCLTIGKDKAKSIVNNL